MRSAVIVGVLLLCLSACRRAQTPAAGEVVSREGQPSVVGVAESDPGMGAAMAQARASLPTFLDELDRADPGAFYSIKARFEEGAETEHIWLVDVERIAGGAIVGVINNEPLAIRSVGLGQRVRIPSDRVSDWLIVKDGKYRGGFTIRQLRKGLSPEEQRQLDEEFGAVPE